MRTTLNPTLDVVFKMLFGAPACKEALIALLTAVLKPSVPIRDVRVLNPELDLKAVGERGVVLDLLVELVDGRRIDVEMQTTRRPGFRRRVMFYWARAFGRQLLRGQQYTDLRPVVSIVFLDYRELPTERFHSMFRVMETTERYVFTDAFELHLIELPKRPRSGIPQCEADLVAWTRFLGANSDEEVKEACMTNPDVAKANEVLAMLSATPDARELARTRELALDTYVIEMTEAKKEGRAEGLAEGRAAGVEEGRAAGVAEGRAEGRLGELRAAIGALAEVLGIDLGDQKRAELDRLNVDGLVELRERLRRERRWPLMP